MFTYGNTVTFVSDGTRPQDCYQIKRRNKFKIGHSLRKSTIWVLTAFHGWLSNDKHTIFSVFLLKSTENRKKCWKLQKIILNCFWVPKHLKASQITQQLVLTFFMMKRKEGGWFSKNVQNIQFCIKIIFVID